MRRFPTLVALALVLSGTVPVSAQDAQAGQAAQTGTKRRERPSGEARGERKDRGDRGDRSSRFRRSRGESASEGEGTGNYELRGFFGSGQNTEISLRQSGTDKAFWIRIGDREKDVYVEKVDPVVGTAVIVTRGTRYRLRLAAEAPISARPVEATPTEAPATATVVVTATAIAPATPANEPPNTPPPPPAAPPAETQRKSE